jgi:hypothetical protein
MAYWARTDQLWASLTPPQKAAAMALMEADNRDGQPDMQSATNVLGAMANRATKEGAELGDHVSGRIYQPTIEDSQRARLPGLIQTPAFQQLTALATSRMKGETPDWVQGATHFLAPESTMLKLEANEPNKYRSWRQWTGFNPETGYQGVVMRDRSHAFLTPDEAATGAPRSAPVMKDAKGNDMMSLMSLLSGGGFNMGGIAAGGSALPSMASAASDPNALQNLFGSLASFGGGGKAGGGDGDGGGLKMATDAATAAGGGDEAATKMQARPFDMQRLASMLAKSGYLGTSQPRRPA